LFDRINLFHTQAFLICFALCVLAAPAEDETLGSFAADIVDPREPQEILKKLKKIKLLKLLG
jgi:hypothetical protein